ncbi:hypothetical protein LTR36_009573 [Oleoguttula mirabilis]|uniref:Uncharacterized protein n=1 Tax=Oleoguttula mirabilis TaxID=1507867 RepID=A0AAV9JSL8_9PEZI|nr:hypothetical protein LTR36_009573 [Oleoguttula mirabilis]
MAYGRGGAGNIQAIEQDSARVAADLEANQQDGSTGVPAAANVERQEQQYAHKGRGGVGNWYSPKELKEKGHFNDAHRSHILGDGTQPPANSADVGTGNAPPSYNAAQPSTETIKTYGRGGAGNYSFGVSESEERAARKRMQQEETKEKLKAEIEKNVQQSLAMPAKAKLPSGEFEEPL